MYVKDFLKIYGKKVIYSTIIILGLLAVSIGIHLFIVKFFENKMVKLEIIIDNYNKSVNENKIEANNKAITELNNLITETKFGFANKISHYWLGNLLFDEKKYNEAYEAFDYFIKKSSDDVFVPIAINKAAICLEESGQIDDAIIFLNKYLNDKKNKVSIDQMYYNLGRLYQLSNNQIKARESFKHVIDEYPESVYANRSKERLFLLSAVK
jgi:TolA-binding protein